MARVPENPTMPSTGLTTMSMTIQCPACGVVLNVPESAAGRKLKCPHCATKFPAPPLSPADSAIAGSSGGPSSSLFASRGPGSSIDIDSPARRGSSGSVELPSAAPKTGGTSGDFDLPSLPMSGQGTFELSLFDDVPPPKPRPKPAASPVAPTPGAKPETAPKAIPTPSPAATPLAADVMALLADEPKSVRKSKGAEARSRARRCPTCGGVVSIGMSLCNNCGLDLDTGQRVTLDLIDDEMPEPYRAPTPPMGALIVGSLFAILNVLLTVASLVAYFKGFWGYGLLVVVWGFGIYASVQFLRRKSIRPLFLAMSLAVGIGVVDLIALPIIQANTADEVDPNVTIINPDNPDGLVGKPLADKLDMQKITWGIASLLGYAAVTVYLNSPGLRREFKS